MEIKPETFDYSAWRTMRSAPMGRKIMALNEGGVAVMTVLNNTNVDHFTAWAPLPKKKPNNLLPEDTERRLKRIESRMCQLMLHLGLDPYERLYETDSKHSETNT